MSGPDGHIACVARPGAGPESGPVPGVPRSSLSRRADYTHQHNVSAGCYGWLRLTPAYSLKIVSEILAGLDEHADARVLDPFCGTGTTALCASYYGQAAVTTEINPFLVRLSRAKTDYYAPRMVAGLRAAGQVLADDLHRRDCPRAPLPQMRNIERWWNSATLDFLRSLRGRSMRDSPRRSSRTRCFCWRSAAP